MTRRRALRADEIVPGQMSFDGSELEEPPVLPKRKRALGPDDPPQYVEQKQKRIDCDVCWAAQVDADKAGRPAPHRRRAVWLREAWMEKPMYLCVAHGQDKATADGGFFSRAN